MCTCCMSHTNLHTKTDIHTCNNHRFEQDAVFEVDMEELATVCLLFADEVDRLRGEDGGGNHEDRGANNR